MIKIWQQYFALSSDPLIITSTLGHSPGPDKTKIFLTSPQTESIVGVIHFIKNNNSSFDEN